MLRSRLAITSIIACICFSSALRADSDTQLPKDPNNIYGQFDNGMKYIVRKNASPPGKVALDLHVRSGSLNETDQQNGLAHFMEHMAFNGSEHYAPGKLIPLLTHLGMTFGADTNAHTNLWETVFKLTMPDAKPETIDTALTIFSDYASGLGLSQPEIDSERGVILEEKRAGKSAAERLQKKMTKELFPGTHLAIHDVIGDEDLIKHFPRSEFLDYWNTWYRPENMTLIVAGDIDPQTVIDAAKKKLGDIKGRGPTRQPVKAGLTPSQETKVLVLTDPEQVGADVELMTMKQGRPPVTTYEQYRREVVENISEWIVNRRFDEVVRKGGAPFRNANVDTSDFLNEGLEVGISSEGEPEDWNKMLDAQIVETSRAIDHGFSKHELELAKSELLSGSQRAVDTESSRESAQIVAGISAAIGRNRPILSAQQRLDLMKRTLDSVSVDELHDVFVDNFKNKDWSYVVMLPANKSGFTVPSKDDVLAAGNAAWMKKPDAQEEKEKSGSILASEPDAGKVVSEETDKDLDITTVTFANGVVMHYKFNDYKKDSVNISMLMPGGTIEETPENRGVSQVASIILARPATSRFTSSQIRDLMTGKTVTMGGGIGLDSLTVGVSGNNKDLAAGMQLAYAVLTDGTLEPSALDEWKKNSLKGLQMMKTSPQGQLQIIVAQTIAGGDPRFGPLSEKQINRQERSPAEAWFKRIVGNAAMEVTVVGDIKKEDAVNLVAKYYGSLPKRNDQFNALDSLRKLSRGNGPFEKTVTFESQTPKAITYAGFISCESLDPERRPLSLAARILTSRMIDRIREKEQLVYSIGCGNQPGAAIPGMGTMLAGAPTDPQNADKLGSEIIEILKDFADKGPTDEELADAKKQTANDMESLMKEPTFWMAQIGEMAYRGRSLEDLKELPQIFQTFTTQQIQDAFRKYCKDDSMIKLEAIPKSPESTTMPTATPAKEASVQKSMNDPKTGAP